MLTMTISVMLLLNFCLRSIFTNGMRFYFKTASKIVLNTFIVDEDMEGT